MSTYKWDDKAWRHPRTSGAVSAFRNGDDVVSIRSSDGGNGYSVKIETIGKGTVLSPQHLCHRSDGTDYAKRQAEKVYEKFKEGK